jgi:hypothetical protein
MAHSVFPDRAHRKPTRGSLVSWLELRAAQRLSIRVQAGVPTGSYQGEPRRQRFQGGPVASGLRVGSLE